jgi:hypothetical protein
LDFDPYYHAFLNVSTHILAPELSEKAVRAALLEGRAYVSHDWMCDPTGFVFGARMPDAATWTGLMGAEVNHTPGMELVAEFPVACTMRLLKDGEEIRREPGRQLRHAVDGPGVYRLEGWLEIDTEERVWIYANPLYVR